MTGGSCLKWDSSSQMRYVHGEDVKGSSIMSREAPEEVVSHMVQSQIHTYPDTSLGFPDRFWRTRLWRSALFIDSVCMKSCTVSEKARESSDKYRMEWTSGGNGSAPERSRPDSDPSLVGPCSLSSLVKFYLRMDPLHRT